MIFIGGVQPRTVVLSDRLESCPYCGHVAARRQRIDHYISLFFIPLIPVKRGIPHMACGHCKNVVGGGAGGSQRTGSGGYKGCGHCGSPVEEEYVYCPYCGKRV